jgi:hypothetical protein
VIPVTCLPPVVEVHVTYSRQKVWFDDSDAEDVMFTTVNCNSNYGLASVEIPELTVN